MGAPKAVADHSRSAKPAYFDYVEDKIRKRMHNYRPRYDLIWQDLIILARADGGLQTAKQIITDFDGLKIYAKSDAFFDAARPMMFLGWASRWEAKRILDFLGYLVSLRPTMVDHLARFPIPACTLEVQNFVRIAFDEMRPIEVEKNLYAHIKANTTPEPGILRLLTNDTIAMIVYHQADQVLRALFEEMVAYAKQLLIPHLGFLAALQLMCIPRLRKVFRDFVFHPTLTDEVQMAIAEACHIAMVMPTMDPTNEVAQYLYQAIHTELRAYGDLIYPHLRGLIRNFVKHVPAKHVSKYDTPLLLNNPYSLITKTSPHEAFAIVVLLSDDYLYFHRRSKSANSSDWDAQQRARQWLRLLVRLPMELQAFICRLLYPASGAIVDPSIRPYMRSPNDSILPDDVDKAVRVVLSWF